jgi:hypothetical protein
VNAEIAGLLASLIMALASAGTQTRRAKARLHLEIDEEYTTMLEWIRKMFAEEDRRPYTYDPPRAGSIPSVFGYVTGVDPAAPETRESQPIPYFLETLHYPAQPEPEPEPSPLAVINRRWKYTGQETRSSREPPKPAAANGSDNERPSKLPRYKVEAHSRGAYHEEPTPRRENEPPLFALPHQTIAVPGSRPEGYKAVGMTFRRTEDDPPAFWMVPAEAGPEMGTRAELEEPAQAAARLGVPLEWLECVQQVADPEALDGWGWVTLEQRDWMQELKRQLLLRGEAACRSGRLDWARDEYRGKFGDIEILCWNAVRTGMNMFDFTAMLQWEKENGVGRGLFDTAGGPFDYRGHSFL